MDFNSVERVVEFLDMDQEAPTITDIRTPTNVTIPTLRLYMTYLHFLYL